MRHAVAHQARAGRAGIVAAFLAIYVIWGSTYLAIRFAVETLPPFLMASGRYLIAGAVTYAWARHRGAARPTASEWRATALIGAFLLLGGNGAVVWAARLVPSGISALIVATIPFWMVGLEWVWRGGARPTPRVVLGLVVGFIGLGCLLRPGALPGQAGVNLFGAGLLLLGALSWSTGSVYSRHAGVPSSSLLAIGMEQIAGSVLLLSAGLARGEAVALDLAAVSVRSWLAVAYLVVFGSLLGFSAYIWLLRVSTPARVATYAYVNPVIAVFLGWLLADEALTSMTLLAAAIIVVGVILITTGPARKAPRGAGRPAGAVGAAAASGHIVGGPEPADSAEPEPALERR